MTINSQIKTSLQEFGIPVDDGIAYLLSVYFECRPSYTPSLLIQRVNLTNILGIDENRDLKWNIPLFEEMSTAGKWEWVKDWVDSFGNINKLRRGNVKTATTRMKAFFAENPDVRKEEIIGATQMYFRSLSSSEYLTTSHYFIFKDKGKDRVSPLEEWIEKYQLMMAGTVLPDNAFEDLTTKMQ
jgi:hypothetical protein